MSDTRRHFILGTAGHVDHGKSALIKALTGVETDRLKEERARGISIELGFAEFPLDDDVLLGVVDVPGHERFVKQMVAGAGGVDLAFLVVAADEGVMPQTVEHLEILSQLGVRGGVVVITKVDLVERELAEVALEEVRDLCRNTFLQDKPEVLVSAHSGEGLDDLRKALRAQVDALPDRDISGPFRLPVDRIFTMPGAGVIVTGTSWEGSVSAGDQLVLEPGGKKLRIRDVQAHGQVVTRGVSGQRLALALHGVKKDDVERGDQVASPGSCRVVRRFDARVTLVPHFDGALKNRQRVHVHHAGREVLGRVSLLDVQEMSHDGACPTGLIQVHLEDHLVARPGDRFVVRFYSPLTTMAGGKVLACDPPRHKRFDDDVLAELAILEEGKLDELFHQQLRDAATEGLRIKDHAAFTEDPEAIAAGKRFYHREVAAHIGSEVAELIEKYLVRFALRRGMPKEEMRRRVKFKGGSAEWTVFCETIGVDHGWKPEGERIVPVVAPEMAPELAAGVEALRRALADAGLQWPGAEALMGALPGGDEHGHAPEEWVRHLQERGDAVAITPEYLVDAGALTGLRTALCDRFREQAELSFAEFRELSGLTRKLGIPMLEYLDRNGWTRRQGDVRIAGPQLDQDEAS